MIKVDIHEKTVTLSTDDIKVVVESTVRGNLKIYKVSPSELRIIPQTKQSIVIA